MTTHIDLFTNVHKGIRRALFETCIALGRASDEASTLRARAMLEEALHFTAHHGENEDVLLVPIVARHSPALADRMAAGHVPVEAALGALRGLVNSGADAVTLYAGATSFTALYLGHMADEERELDAMIRAVVPADELLSFGRGSVERTSPADQKMMLGWMLPAMTSEDVEAFFAKLPPDTATALRPLAVARR